MAMQFRCPTCDTLLKPSAAIAAGSRIRCPGCKTVFTMPESEESDPYSQRVAPVCETEDRPRSSRGRRDGSLDDYEDRSRSSRRRDDDHPDDRPRRKRPARSKGGIPVLVWILGGVGLALILACGVIGLVVWRVAHPAWKDFSSPEGGFTATYPGAPTRGTQIDPLGSTSTLFYVETDWGRVRYLVGYADMQGPDFGIDPDIFLNTAAALLITVRTSKQIQIDGHPGLEVTGPLVQNGVQADVIDRIFLVNRRMYHVMVESQAGYQNPADFAKFLDSFQLPGGGRAGPR